MKLPRLVPFAALAAVACVGLTACQSKVGAAAVIDGHRITEDQISAYVTKAGVSPGVQGGSSFAPRSEVLTELVRQRIYETALERTGGVPGPQQLAKLHDEGAQRFIGGNVGGPTLDRELRAQAVKFGLNSSFVTLLVRNAELGDAVVRRVHAPTFPALVKALGKYTKSVSVSPRYGRWVKAQLSIRSAPTDGAPHFVKMSAAPQA